MTKGPFKTRIREMRHAAHMTLRELATPLGTTPQTVQRLETDNMTVSIEWLQRIADILKVPVHVLADTTRGGETAEGTFFNRILIELLRARRAMPSHEDALPGLMIAVGQLSEGLLEHKAGLRHWTDIQQRAAATAAAAMRIALDAESSETTSAPAMPAPADEPLKLVGGQP
jgi:transcriptional regulator with XRE-family HTH domain